jgi:hypothetical protein
LFDFLKKKKDSQDEENASIEASEAVSEEVKEKPASASDLSGNASKDILKVSSDIDRLKVSVESFTEVRKSFTERFTRVSEQIGELRAMILERDKTIQEIELKAMKASDLVESVHPEKMTTEIQKQDVKLEALKANIEGNEAIMNKLMDEIKEVKRKIEFFKGVEEVVKLSEEIKLDLIEIKKTESKIGLDTDKVETFYSEIRKKYQDSDIMVSNIQEIKVIQDQNQKDINFLKDKITTLADKEELEKLIQRVQRYIDALKDLEKKSSLTKDISTLKTIMDSLK